MNILTAYSKAFDKLYDWTKRKIKSFNDMCVKMATDADKAKQPYKEAGKTKSGNNEIRFIEKVLRKRGDYISQNIVKPTSIYMNFDTQFKELRHFIYKDNNHYLFGMKLLLDNNMGNGEIRVSSNYMQCGDGIKRGIDE